MSILLFIDLFSSYSLCSCFAAICQCDFQTVYASGIKGKAGLSPKNLGDDLGPLFEAILRCIPEPRIEKDGALQLLVSNKLGDYIVMYLTCGYDFA